MNTQSLRDRLANFNNKQKNSSGSTTFEKARWYATDEHDIRFVPTNNKGTYYDCNELVCFRDSEKNILVVELMFHGNVARFPFLCAAQFGDECPVCDYAKFLGRWKDDDGNDRPESERKADFQIVKKIRRAPKYACNVVERGKESEGPLWFLVSPGSQKDVTGFHKILEFCGSKIYRKMCGVTEENELQVLFGTENALDVHISFQKSKNQDGKGNTTGYAAVVFQMKADDTSPLTKSKAETKKLVESVKKLELAYQRKTTKEIEELLEEFTSGKQEELKVGPSSEEKFATNSNESVADLSGEQAINDELEKLLSDG
jgi:hypothetical protein